MAWGGPVEPAQRRDSWKKEIRQGPRPRDPSAYSEETAARDRMMVNAFGTQVSFAIAFSILILAAAIFYAQYSGAVRWLLGIVVLATGAYILVRFVGTRARDPRPLRRVDRVERHATGDLWSLAITLDRAAAGLKFSQVMFAARMKDAFLEKVRVSRGLTEEAMNRARGDPEALLALVGDADLTVFLLESERNHRHWPSLLRYL